MKKGFSLIELLVVIVILGILTSIVLPNISDVKQSALKSGVSGNIRNLQTAIDAYQLDHNGMLPAGEQPELGKPEPLDFSLLYPNYIKQEKDQMNAKYWVDSGGMIWGSTVEAPMDITVSDHAISWRNSLGTVKNEIYEVIKPNTSAVQSVQLKKVVGAEVKEENNISTFETEPNKNYLISSIDDLGLETAPTNFLYSGYQPSTDEGISFPIETTGEFNLTTNAHAPATWIGIQAKQSTPEGTSITYSFATSDDGKNFSDFETDIEKLPHSQYLKVHLSLEGSNGKKPRLQSLRVIFHVDHDSDESVFEFSPKTNILESKDIQIEGTGVSGKEGSHYSQLIEFEESVYFSNVYIGKRVSPDSDVRVYYQSSTDGVHFSERTTYIEQVPQGSYLLITYEFYGGRSAIDQVTVTTSKTVSSEIWRTLDTANYSFDAGEDGTWLSVTAVDNQPTNTRILYSYYSTKANDIRSSTVSDIEKVPDGRYLDIVVTRQVKKTALEEPELFELSADYRLPNGVTKKAIKSLNVQKQVQGATDKYIMDTGTYPTNTEPTEMTPQSVDFTKLVPNYLPSTPQDNSIKYLVDFQGTVWDSTINPPTNIHSYSDKIYWDGVANASAYQIYELSGYEGTSVLSKVFHPEVSLIPVKKTTDTIFTGESGKAYVISAIDINGKATAPSGPTTINQLYALKNYGTYSAWDKEGQQSIPNELSSYLINKNFADGMYTLRHGVGATTTDLKVDVHTYIGDTTYTTSPVLGNNTLDDHMLMLRYEGNLTVAAGATLTPQVRKKGMMIYVEGDLTVNGKISMTARGANAAGQNLYVIKDSGQTLFAIPANGATGAAGVTETSQSLNGKVGTNGTNGQTGGGGSGGSHCNSCTATSGAGAAGTSFSGGSGGGGVSRMSSNGNAQNGAANGGKGGDGSGYQPDNGWAKIGSGGAGNNRGTTSYGGTAGSAWTNAQDGTGGLLILIVKGNIIVNGTIESKGSNGGSSTINYSAWNAGGGGSGGGSINIFYGGSYTNKGTITAQGGLGGTGVFGTNNTTGNNGGNGGNGSITTKAYIPTFMPKK